MTGTFGLPGSLPEHKFSVVVIRIDAEMYTPGFKFSNLYLERPQDAENLFSNSHRVERSQERKVAVGCVDRRGPRMQPRVPDLLDSVSMGLAFGIENPATVDPLPFSCL